MPMAIEKLTPLRVGKLRAPGLYSDGGGLYLRVAPGGSKGWIFRYKRGSRQRDMGLGALHTVGLHEARQHAMECRRLLQACFDPIDQRDAERGRAKRAAAAARTFKTCAKDYIAAHRPAWRNAKHAAQWPSTLETYVYPVIGDTSVQHVTTELVLQIIEPIWHSKTETATRVRMRIEAVLDWATAKKYRTGDNPARWHGLIGELLPAPGKVKRSKPFPSLPYSELPSFMERLRGIEAVGARALEYLILTIARTSQVTDMPWLEYDPEGPIWNVPFDRMKGGRAHRVPLAKDAVAVLDKMAKLSTGDVVFPGRKQGRPISTATMAKLLKDMGFATGTATVHGFRATFKTWATDRGYPWEAVEMAMSHAVGNKVERAYLRSDLLNTRRQLAEDWAAYCRAAFSHGVRLADDGGIAIQPTPTPAIEGSV
jgi:integrase